MGALGVDVGILSNGRQRLLHRHGIGVERAKRRALMSWRMQVGRSFGEEGRGMQVHRTTSREHHVPLS